jgi:hypothetical protein
VQNGESREDVEVVESQPPPPPPPAEGEQQPETSNGTVAVEASAAVPEDETQTQSEQTQGDGAPPSESSVVAPLSASDHDLQIPQPDTQISTTTAQDDSDRTPVLSHSYWPISRDQDTEKNESSDNAEGTRTEDVAAPSESAISQQNEGTATGDSTPVQDGASTPSTPRSTPAKPSVFKKAASIQKVTLNKDFLKSILPGTQSPSPGASTTPRPATTEKRTSLPMCRFNSSETTVISDQGAQTDGPDSSGEYGYVDATSRIWIIDAQVRTWHES